MELPVFKGYVVDVRLKEFRKVTYDHSKSIEFVPFGSEKGDRLLCQYIDSLSKADFEKFASEIRF